MSFVPTSRIGAQLYRLLPEVYRERDQDQHLQAYLDGCGELLDRVYATLRQRLDDNFPDTCQEWLIPYFAELLDVSLKSPAPQGRRQEVARAIAWRQTKGTAACTEEIAEAVGAMEVELQEAFRRVARTSSVGEQLLPAALLGGTTEPDRSNPLLANQHPGLPAVTVDFRKHSRAVQAAQPSLVTQRTFFRRAGTALLWSQANPRGAPCFPGSFEDRSLRTLDLRTPDFGRGHFHPKRLLAFVAPAAGFFADAALQFDWSARAQAVRDGLLEEIQETDSRPGPTGRIAIVRTLYRRPASQPATVRIRGVINFDAAPPGTPEQHVRFEGFHIETLTAGSAIIELQRCAVVQLAAPAVEAVDCLLRELQVGSAQLECCTVLANAVCAMVSAVDTLFAGELRRPDGPQPPRVLCLRHVRVPPELLTALTPLPTDSEPVRQDKQTQRNRVQRSTTELPVFLSTDFGVPGCAVLHPACAEAIRAGAEDGGELGAYHHQHLCLREGAVLDKLAEYLPFGMEAVLIPDQRLNGAPPQLPTT